MKRLATILMLGLLLVGLLPMAVGATPLTQRHDGKEYESLTLTSNFTLHENDRVNGDVVLMGGNLTLDGTVDGDVVIFGGNIDLNGEVDGEVVIFGGNVTVSESAVVDGDCVVLGGTKTGTADDVSCAVSNNTFGMELTESLSRLGWENWGDWDEFEAELEAELEAAFAEEHRGQLEAPSRPDRPEQPGRPERPERPDHSEWDHDHNRRGGLGILAGILGSGLYALFIGGLSFAVATIFPDHLHEVRRATEEKPAASGIVGFLTTLAVPSILGIVAFLTLILIWFCIGIIGFPIMLAVGLGFAAACLLGWTAVGAWVGDWVANRIGWQARPATVAAVGTTLMTLGVGLLGLLPLVPESLISSITLFIGLGAVVLTKFGRQPYPPRVANQSKIDTVLETMPEDLK